MEDVQKLRELIAALAGEGVEFVIVGGVAAVLAGAPIVTFDLDIIPEPSRANLGRLAGVLERLDARYLDLAGRTLRPTLDRLVQNRLNLLATNLGRLDVMREIGAAIDFGEARRRSTEYPALGFPIRALDLEAVIESKQQAGRDKDRGHLALLRETLRLQRLKDGD